MFNPDFYPTPEDVINQMLGGLDIQQKTVLEPSSGSGNILKLLKEIGCKTLACEKNPDLKKISQSYCDVFLKDDFLEVTKEEVSHIDFVIMNPPFSQGKKHVMHAFEIAPSGCTIVSLINADNLNNYDRSARELDQLINSYGYSEDLGECFTTAERKTNVRVAKIVLHKPALNDYDFDGFFMDDEHQVNTEHGLIKPNAIRDLVERYVDAIKEFDKFDEVRKKMNDILSPFNLSPISCHVKNENSILDRNSFASELQKVFWQRVFKLMDIEKFLTTGVKQKINEFSERQNKVPFTMKNIYALVDMVYQTQGQIYQQALIEAVDKFTQYTHENRYHVEGWKTNSGHLLNEKIIVPYLMERNFSGGQPSVRYSNNASMIDDLQKVICSLFAINYNEIESVYSFFSGKIKQGYSDYSRREYEYKEWGVKYDWFIFEIKAFKKGTLHLKFKNREQWARLNQAYAHAKGMVLPEKF